MRVLATFPGKYGDILWALPTVRAIAETIGEPVDLLVSAAYGAPEFLRLLQAPPYIGKAMAMLEWAIQETAPMTPREPPLVTTVPYQQVVHLGYAGWPGKPLPFEIYDRAVYAYPQLELLPATVALNLSEPWIRLPPRTPALEWFHDQPIAFRRIAVGFTDEWFELKYGLTWLLTQRSDWEVRPVVTSPRWNSEGQAIPCSWIDAVDCIEQAEVFVGCCSALHVLSAALGKTTIVVEPNPQRHHAIFWPLGTDGPIVYGVKGGDGQLTFDARALGQLVERELLRTEIRA